MQQEKKSSGNRGMLFLLGAAVGAAAGYYLNTDEGRRMTRQAGNRINEFGQEVGHQARRQYDSLASGVNTAVGRGKELINEVGSNIKSKVNNLTHRTEQNVDEYGNQLKSGLEEGDWENRSNRYQSSLDKDQV